MIILDTESTLRATTMNPNLVTDIRTIRNPVGMTTNAKKAKTGDNSEGTR